MIPFLSVNFNIHFLSCFSVGSLTCDTVIFYLRSAYMRWYYLLQGLPADAFRIREGI